MLVLGPHCRKSSFAACNLCKFGWIYLQVQMACIFTAAGKVLFHGHSSL